MGIFEAPLSLFKPWLAASFVKKVKKKREIDSSYYYEMEKSDVDLKGYGRKSWYQTFVCSILQYIVIYLLQRLPVHPLLLMVTLSGQRQT